MVENTVRHDGHPIKKQTVTSTKCDPKPLAWWRGALPSAALGVLAFSLSFPATRAAVPELGSVTVGIGRAAVAACLAGVLLLLRQDPFPERRHWASLALVALGVVVGFPLFSAIALRSLPSAHGAVLIGLLPAATAMVSVLRGHERPPRVFWASVAIGIAAVLLFAAAEGAGHPQIGDAWLLASVLCAAVGYAEGGHLAREMEGGWRVICWALLFAAPLVLPVTAIVLWNQGGLPAHISVSAVVGFVYVAVVSMFFGFFPWYRGLALGGVAQASQIQLIQPVMTLLWSSLLLGEAVKPQTVLASLAVVASVGFAQRARLPGRKSTSV